MRGVSTRGKRMTGVMAHQGFSGVTIDRPEEGICIYVPREQLNKNGIVKKKVRARLKGKLTIENAVELSTKGVVFEKVNYSLGHRGTEANII